MLRYQHFQLVLKIYLYEKGNSTINERFLCSGNGGALCCDEYYKFRKGCLSHRKEKDRPDLKVLITDIYIAGEGDIIEIMYEYSDIDCIVLVGYYNRYSGAAKDLAKDNNIALYDYREFWGAVHCTGSAFLNYKRKYKE